MKRKKVEISMENGEGNDAVNTIEEHREIAEVQEEQLKSTKEEINRMREENERLKSTLSEILEDYHSLQIHFSQILQRDNNIEESPKEPTAATLLLDPKPASHSSSPAQDDGEEDELVSLRLGEIRASNSGRHGKKEGENKKMEKKEKSESKEEEDEDEELTTLKLDYNCSGSIGEEQKSSLKEEGNGEQPQPWPPAAKIAEKDGGGGDKVLQQQQEEVQVVKKARVSVRTRCDAATMNDGCQWRKYGQKVAKGNPCPRAYYRCTLSPSCPVRKQVQRCLEDKSILITTYEGTHNHPLPLSATAMASTTAAAASMLLSGASSASESPDSAVSSSLNFGIFNASRQRQQLSYLQNPSFSSTSSNSTVTLDLTSSQPANQFNLISSSGYSSTSFNFSYSESNATAKAWSSTGCLSYGSQQPKMSTTTRRLNLGRQSQEPSCQLHLQKAGNQHRSTETIAKAITTDPSFQLTLQDAVSSHIGTQSGKEGPGHGGCFNKFHLHNYADRMDAD